MGTGNVAVGIDVGTTTIGLIALDLETGKVLDHRSVPNVRLPSRDGYTYLQDPVAIGRSVEDLLSRLPVPYSSIGVTGQVHGILYLDRNGEALSPLATWLDRRGDERLEGGSPRERLLANCGATMPAGYGLLTHYANTLTESVPEGATRISGILEYVTGRLIGRPLEKADTSCLAAFGAWDPAAETHDPCIMAEILPAGAPAFFSAAAPFSTAGEMTGGVPVSYPVGDNQAGFFALVSDPRAACLVSVGTSGQLTVFSPSVRRIAAMELRPFLGLGYLQVGATLCAGKAYEVLQRFVRSILVSAGAGDRDDGDIYALMESAAREAEAADTSEPLRVETTFNGSRLDSTLRGSIRGIGLDNFSLGNLVRGTVDGIVRELHDFRADLDREFRSVRTVVAAGNAVRRNPLFADSLRRQFGLEVEVPDVDDAAAVGIALIGAMSAGIIQRGDAVRITEKLLGRTRS